MIRTGSHNNFKKSNYSTYAISGNRGKDANYTGECFPALAPKLSFWKVWHDNIGKISEEENNRYYVEQYYLQVLSKLDPLEIFEELDNSILLCYEENLEFCHRHIVAEWLQLSLDIKVPEVKVENNELIELERPNYIRTYLEDIMNRNVTNIVRTQCDNNAWYDYYLNNGSNQLKIVFLGNGDLYFCSRFGTRSKEAEFYITKENMILYNLFDELYNDIVDANVLHVDEFDLQFCNDEEEIKEKYERVNRWNEELKTDFAYENLVRGDMITWISDDSLSFDIDTADSLRIIKEDEQYKLKFTYYEDEFPHARSIRIRNSGSRYKPFNMVMMKFFNKLQEYDPEYHQIHIEEYLYNKNKVKELTKK